MAVILYKKNKSGEVERVIIDSMSLQEKLDEGCCFTKEEAQDRVESGPVEQSVVKLPTPETVKIPTFKEADTNKTGKLSNKEVRAAAKLAKIEGYDTLRITTLKEMLGYGKS